MIDIPRSLEFAIIMLAREKGNDLEGLFRPVFHFDGQFGWFTQAMYMHNFGEADGKYEVKNLKMADDGMSLSFTAQRIDKH